DHALDSVCGFGPASATIGVSRKAIGKRADDVGGDMFELVQSRHHEHRKSRNGGGEQLEVGAEVLNDLQLQTEHGAVALGGELVIVHMTASVNRAEEILAA